MHLKVIGALSNDLEVDSYNTRIYAGLPPSPIAPENNLWTQR